MVDRELMYRHGRVPGTIVRLCVQLLGAHTGRGCGNEGAAIEVDTGHSWMFAPGKGPWASAGTGTWAMRHITTPDTTIALWTC